MRLTQRQYATLLRNGARPRSARTPRARGPSERAIQRHILGWLKLHGILAWRFNSGAMTVGKRFVRFHTARGCSDVLAIVRQLGGRLLAVEVKRKGGTPTPHQTAFLEQVRAAGGIACCVSSVEELEQALRREGWTP